MSLWTGTPMFRLRRDHAIVHTLACALAHEAFAVTELVTDRRGLEIADRLGWRYTTYVPCLDEINDPALEHIWARGKLTALTVQSSPFCHIDNDVLLHAGLPKRMTQAPLLAQSKDDLEYYTGDLMKKAIATSGYPFGACPYNVGLVGGTNIPLIQKYAEGALADASKFANGEHEINGTTVSMVLEQYGLGVFARRERVRVEEHIPIPKQCVSSDHKASRYSHLVGPSKADQREVSRVENRLREQFPAAYNDFVRGWRILTRI